MRAILASVVLGSIGLGGMVRADEPGPDPARLTIATDRVVVFKDGHALFAKTARGTADGDGRVYTERVPDAAVLGCFWAAREDGRALLMRAEWVERAEERQNERACVSIGELLRVNTGRTLTLEAPSRERS